MKEIYFTKIKETLDSSLTKYIQLNDVKIQKMVIAKFENIEKVLLLLGYINTALYIHKLLPNLIIYKKTTLFLGARQNFMNYI